MSVFLQLVGGWRLALRRFSSKMEEVKEAIASILTRPEYLIETPRTATTRKAVEEILQASMEESNAEMFGDFAENLLGALQGLFTGLHSKSGKLISGAAEKVLSSFHRLRMEKLDVIWKELYEIYEAFGETLTKDQNDGTIHKPNTF